MGISITYFFGLRMGVGMGMVFIYNQLLISVFDYYCIFRGKNQEPLYNLKLSAYKFGYLH
jgi:hypothetical protein